MENSLHFLERVCAVLIFCTAFAGLLIGNLTLQNNLTTLKRMVNTKSVLYEQPLEEIVVEKVTYASLMGVLMHELPYDITINELDINKDNYNPQTFDFNKIHKTNYHKSYKVDGLGNIIRIVYIG